MEYSNTTVLKQLSEKKKIDSVITLFILDSCTMSSKIHPNWIALPVLNCSLQGTVVEEPVCLTPCELKIEGKFPNSSFRNLEIFLQKSCLDQ